MANRGIDSSNSSNLKKLLLALVNIFAFADFELTTLVKLLGLPMAVTEYEIKNLFSRYGNVVSCVRGTASFCRGGVKEGEDKLKIVAFTHN